MSYLWSSAPISADYQYILPVSCCFERGFVYVTCFIIINQLQLLTSSRLQSTTQPATGINFQSKAFNIIHDTICCLELSFSSYTKSSATITAFKAHLKTACYSNSSTQWRRLCLNVFFDILTFDVPKLHTSIGSPYRAPRMTSGAR